MLTSYTQFTYKVIVTYKNAFTKSDYKFVKSAQLGKVPLKCRHRGLK